MKLTIIGLGLIGGSMAKDLRKAGFATEIIGVDVNPAHAREAVKLGIVDRTGTLKPSVKKADMVLVAIPVDKIITVLPKVLDLISPSTTVTDVGSSKRSIVAKVKNHPNRSCFVPSHPMSGTENSGPSAATDNLFEGKISIICDQQDSKPQHVAIVEKMYHSMGMSTAYMSSDEQDHTTAFVSHLPHAAAFALANAVLAKEDRSIIFDLASGGFRSTVRLAKSSPAMWGPIFKQNKDYISQALEVYITHLQELKSSIENNDKNMMKLINKANSIREVLENDNPSLTKSEKTIVKLYTKS